MIGVDINDQEARDLINELKRRMGNLTPVMEAVGQIIQSGTQQRFVDQRGPDGSPWDALSPVTLARRRKAGRGAQILRDTGRLMNSISYKVTGDSVKVFTNVIYAGTQQLGARQGAYRASPPVPWGNIPARPFLGYSADDNAAVIEVLQGYLQANQPLSWWQRLVSRFRRIFT